MRMPDNGKQAVRTRVLNGLYLLFCLLALVRYFVPALSLDIPLACLSEKPCSFFDYFNQLFAQVTNPPIDALRESFITSTLLYVGNHGNLLEDARSNCRLIRSS